MKAAKAVDVLNTINENARKSMSNARVVRDIPVGKKVRQGDIYLERISELPKSLGELQRHGRLVDGNTQGASHVVSPLPVGFKLFAPVSDSNPLVGPVISSSERFTVTHQEHGHFSLPAGCYQVRYQRDYSQERAEELRRVRD